MPRIRILSPGLVNRIAAGECVERPASVVKELVENALDAGASRIDVTIHDGGRSLIRVCDDGCGIDADDLRLALTPHATSKIRADDDLFNIHTMGFRGEALPSIAAVSRLMVRSRTRESDVGHEFVVDAGAGSGPSPCAAPAGTSVEVRDLFYCVPARQRFLRTNTTEMGHITEQFARIALAHPGIAFSLGNQKRTTQRLDATDDRRSRIADYFGRELADALLPIVREGNGVRVEGFVAPPALARGSGKWEYLFVNGRYVRDRFVSHAVREAYRSLIEPGRYPVAIIYITLDPSAVDVNVHPTKTEVRWRDSNYIHGQVLAALREKFLSTNLDRELRTPRDEEAYRENVRSAMVDFFTKARPAGERHEGTKAPRHIGPKAHRHEGRDAVAEPREETGIATAGAGAPASVAPGVRAGRDLDSAFDAGPAVGTNPRFETGPSVDRESRQPLSDGHDERSETPAPHAIQIHNTYLVVETADGCMIIDQHALHERILYEELRARVTRRPLESQRLLLPEVVRVPADRVEALDTHAAAFERLGIELTASGPQSVTLHAFPTFLERIERETFIRDLLDLLSERGARPETDTLIHEILDMMACKAAVKAGDALTSDEISALLARRDLADRASNCPHGRPTTLHLTLRELERQFKRR